MTSGGLIPKTAATPPTGKFFEKPHGKATVIPDFETAEAFEPAGGLHIQFDIKFSFHREPCLASICGHDNLCANGNAPLGL